MTHTQSVDMVMMCKVHTKYFQSCKALILGVGWLTLEKEFATFGTHNWSMPTYCVFYLITFLQVGLWFYDNNTQSCLDAFLHGLNFFLKRNQN